MADDSSDDVAKKVEPPPSGRGTRFDNLPEAVQKRVDSFPYCFEPRAIGQVQFETRVVLAEAGLL